MATLRSLHSVSQQCHVIPRIEALEAFDHPSIVKHPVVALLSSLLKSCIPLCTCENEADKAFTWMCKLIYHTNRQKLEAKEISSASVEFLSQIQTRCQRLPAGFSREPASPFLSLPFPLQHHILLHGKKFQLPLPYFVSPTPDVSHQLPPSMYYALRLRQLDK